MTNRSGLSQEEFVRIWFEKNADRDVPHIESKPAIEAEWLEKFGSRIEDVDRAIRKLAEQGELVKVRNGVYRFDLQEKTVKLETEFTEFTKTAALERDGFACIMCGAQSDHINDIHVLPISRFEVGGRSSLSNAQTLCSFHALADRLSDGLGGLSRQEMRRILDQVRPGGRITLGDARKFGADFLNALELNASEKRVVWKDFL